MALNIPNSGKQQALAGLLGSAITLGGLALYLQVNSPASSTLAASSASPSASPSPSASASPYASPSPSPSPSASSSVSPYVAASPSPSASASPYVAPSPAPVGLTDSAKPTDIGDEAYFAVALPDKYQIVEGGQFSHPHQIHAVEKQGEKTIEDIILVDNWEVKSSVSRVQLSADRKYLVWQEGYEPVVKVGMFTQEPGSYGLTEILSVPGTIASVTGKLLWVKNNEDGKVDGKVIDDIYMLPANF